MIGLKSCPFCGGEAEILRMGDRRQSMQYGCTECGCFLETGETSITTEQCRWNERYTQGQIDSVTNIHPDDIAVDAFAYAMKQKLAQSRANGRSGWDDPAKCPLDYLGSLLVGHVAKDDPGEEEQA